MLDRPGQRLANVRILASKLTRCDESPWTTKIRLLRTRFSECQVVDGMASSDEISFTTGFELFLGVLPD
jgi:hypothetical protein